MTITARTPLALLLLASVTIACAGCGSSVRPNGDGARRTSGGFPGAPHTQNWDGDAAGGVCQLAARNRYLPQRSGCVTVLRADMAGEGGDLILLYSRLSQQRAAQTELNGRVSSWYVATGAFVRVVRARGGGATARIAGATVAAFLAAAHVNDDPGDELFLQTQEISSGSTAVVYGLQDGRLVPAGVTLGYGGDSATKAGFDCRAGNPPRLVQRNFELDGPTIYAWWTDTEVTYAWHGPRLVQLAKRTFKHRGLPPASATEVGPGCIAGIESYPAGTSGGTAPANAPTPAAVAVSTGGLGQGGLISAVARWHGRLYAAGSYYGSPPLTYGSSVSAPLGCSSSCEPMVWIWSSHPRRWQPVFANQNPATGGPEFLLSTRSALLLFTTGDSTRLWRSTNGRTYATIALPPAMTTATLATTYLSNGTIVAVLRRSTPSAFDNAPVVWTSADGIAWRPEPTPLTGTAG